MFERRQAFRVPLLLVVALALFLFLGCDEAFWSNRNVNGSGGWPGRLPPGAHQASVAPVRIASFNIQSLGPKKLADGDAMRIIVDVVRRFDIVAVQEVRSLDQTIVERLVAAVNAAGQHYDYVLSPRLGRGSYKEQYAFIYNTRTVALDRNSVYTILDEPDYFHREPMVATFQTVVPAAAAPFTFTLINIHIDPDDVAVELSILDDVVRGVTAQQFEDDVILIGDLNARPQNFGPLRELPDVFWVLRSGQWTNTRRSNSYDNILFNSATTVEFTGNAGVIDLQDVYGLSLEQALRVSDHMPIWAEFYPTENAQRLWVATPHRETR